jgi:hypothetical protein
MTDRYLSHNQISDEQIENALAYTSKLERELTKRYSYHESSHHIGQPSHHLASQIPFNDDSGFVGM